MRAVRGLSGKTGTSGRTERARVQCVKACRIRGNRASLFLPVLLAPVLSWAQPLPARTEISIRLTSSVATNSSKVGDPVEAVVIAPVVVNGRAVIASGTLVHGRVEKATPPTGEQRALLGLQFAELQNGGVRQPMAAHVAAVDNAREKVDDEGRIEGILPSETITGRLDAGLTKLGQEYSGFADILSAAKNAVFQPPSTDISYSPGVEMTLRLTEPLTPAPGKPAAVSPGLKPLGDRAALEKMLAHEPFRTMAQRPAQPSDITNVLLLGTEDAVRQAFAAAGWRAAAKLNPLSRFEALRAAAEDRGYDEAPVSLLVLDGKPPDVVFEKTNDTFALRHHLRIWRRPGTFRGKPVWEVAATHDAGVDFSEADRTFIHRIDSQIDREREKVVSDLLFTGSVDGFALVERPDVPRQSLNATGDKLETDGRIAVLVLHRLE